MRPSSLTSHILIIATILVIALATIEALAVENPVDLLDRANDQGQANEAVKLRVKRDPVAKACKWIGDKLIKGWYCDDPASRWLWRTFWWFQGVTDCNSFCKKKKYSRGYCGGKNYDVSTWCPKGKACICR
jgi:hypothetical protein